MKIDYLPHSSSHTVFLHVGKIRTSHPSHYILHLINVILPPSFKTKKPVQSHQVISSS